MNIREMQDEILRLKKEKDICILAHSYVSREITEVADYVGDSFQLSLMAQKASQSTVIMCGVRFMAETVKILSPEKTVILANPNAGCPMAEQMDKEYIESIKKEYPDYTVVAYINTTADLKTVCDVCVTSSSAEKIVGKIENDKILFIPDCNLGSFVADKFPEKTFKLLDGGCPVHKKVTADDVKKARELYPNAKVLVHPECNPSVSYGADYVGSTSGIMNYAKNSDCGEFVVGTENTIALHLQYDCPYKKFHLLSKELICPDMKEITLADLLLSVKGEGGEVLKMDEETRLAAKKCIDRMLELGE